MSQLNFDCIGFGICALDYLCLIPKYPQLDEKTVLSDFSKQGGGPVPTALVTLSRLGARVAYFGKIGNDPEGEFVRQELTREGVSVDYLIRDENAQTPNAFIWIDRDSGKRTVVLNRTKISEISPTEIPLDAVAAKVWLIDGWERSGTLRVATEARRRGQAVVADFGSLREKIDEMLPLVDFPVVSENFVKQYFGDVGPAEASQRLLRFGARAAVVTCGNQGCFGTNQIRTFFQPAFYVPVVDTTGAGDVFHGAFVFGILQEWPLPRILRFASAVAALKCTGFGGRTAIPTLGAVEKFLAANA
jgi:ribokinase